jgi:hypothetical protein
MHYLMSEILTRDNELKTITGLGTHTHTRTRTHARARTRTHIALFDDDDDDQSVCLLNETARVQEIRLCAFCFRKEMEMCHLHASVTLTPRYLMNIDWTCQLVCIITQRKASDPARNRTQIPGLSDLWPSH